MAAIALPSFLGSPEDVTKVVDAYEETSSELRTSLSEKITSFTSGLDGVFGKTVGIAKGIGEKLRTNAVNINDAVKRVQGALKGSRADIVKLASSTEKMIMSELTGVDGSTNYVKTVTDVARGLEIMVGDGKQLIDTFKNGGYDQVNAMVGFISDLTGTPLLKTFDLGAEAAILRGVVEEVSAWGIPDLVDKVMIGQPDRTKYAVIKRSAETISASSSLDVLLAYANVQSDTTVPDYSWIPPADWDGINPPRPTTSQNIGTGALNAATPNFAARVLSNFAFAQGVTVGDYPTQLAKLVELMNKLKPDWFWTTRGTTPVWNLGPMAGASEDAVKLFLSSPVYRDAMLTAPFYTPQRIDELVDSMYPLTTT